MDDAHKDQYKLVDRERYRALVWERDRLVSENERLRDELKRLNDRLNEPSWRVYPDRMGR